ncbi:uncharacterized protein GGS22DRAFT_157256 [Annulohypoxylon maeteangense]|uniref:uncharacterized protein n=1 Tax=Annulohypoxylon maeteangense TaxID=1927788 RepID=UPI002007E514|nr:uncharacterized protein GGS22DRAFT_157256 [Annulohypoxylon maeteangense]KAI0887483.1 hypothetical protein GGS22DRAFT_157256 [Annulohypoxylon maeteangense]
MVLCNLHLISLRNDVSPALFLGKLRWNGIKPIVQARPIRWMVLPTQLSVGHLIGRNIRWDLFLILEETDPIPHEAQLDIDGIWSVSCGVSSKALSGYAAANSKLLFPPPGSVSPPEPQEIEPSNSSQNLETSLELCEWIGALPAEIRDRPVSMLNLLAVNPGKKDDYKKYRDAFVTNAGTRHGANIKLVGRIAGGAAADDGWDEIAFVHYPSVSHFAAMAASRDYQEINHEHRLPSLKDTFILCVMEVDDQANIVDPRQTRERL